MSFIFALSTVIILNIISNYRIKLKRKSWERNIPPADPSEISSLELMRQKAPQDN